MKVKILSKHTLFFTCLYLSFAAYSQTELLKERIYFNSSPDTIVTLNENVKAFEIIINIDTHFRIRVHHVRNNRLISSIISKSNKLNCIYSNTPLTNDWILVQILAPENDSIVSRKNFRLINKYLDDLNRAKTDSINVCNTSIPSPFKYTFNVYVNDQKISNYNVSWFKNIETTQTNNVLYKTYKDSLVTSRTNDDFYISQQYDSIGILISIGKYGNFYYHITNYNFKYGAQFYFSVSTNDKKLNKKYNSFIKDKEFSELREKPYLAIAKNYLNKFRYSNKHSVLFIDCNPKCDPTQVNWDFQSVYYRIKDLK